MEPVTNSPALVTDLIAYQPGAIVSRILLKQPKGNVTLFAFDAAQELSEHTVPYDVLLHVIDGRAEISIEKTPNAVSAGEMIILPGGIPHAVRAITAFKMMLTMIRE